MLDTLEPWQFEELLTASCVGLDVEGWLQMAHMSSEIVNKLEIIHASLVEREPDLREAIDFLPENYRELMGRKIEAPKDDAPEKLRAMYG